MSWDGLLALLLNIVIPLFMAVAGGILAIRAWKEAKLPERITWITVFLGLFLLAVILGFIQQVRATNQQDAADKKAAATELRMTSDTKYTQGQLDSINKVLTAVISKSGDAGLTKGVLEALLQASQKANSSQPYTNSQLKAATIDLVRRLRAMQMAFDSETNDLLSSRQQKMVEAGQDRAALAKVFGEGSSATMNLDSRQRAAFGTIRSEAINMRTELLNRLPPQQEDRTIFHGPRWGFLGWARSDLRACWLSGTAGKIIA
jgi:hypothetical protein